MYFPNLVLEKCIKNFLKRFIMFLIVRGIGEWGGTLGTYKYSAHPEEGCCELPDVGTESWTPVLSKSRIYSECWAIFSVPIVNIQSLQFANIMLEPKLLSSHRIVINGYVCCLELLLFSLEMRHPKNSNSSEKGSTLARSCRSEWESKGTDDSNN